MLPFCLDEGVGVIPWSPLARGILTRDWGSTTERSESDEYGKKLYRQAVDADREIVDAVKTVAEKHGVPRAQVALAWVLKNDAVTAPIVGVTKPHHLTDAVAAADLQLTEEDAELLEQPYLPHNPEGF
jgi:aryl-alcohol dehydrogenase-like predicted oxidoreductase